MDTLNSHLSKKPNEIYQQSKSSVKNNQGLALLLDRRFETEKLQENCITRFDIRKKKNALKRGDSGYWDNDKIQRDDFGQDTIEELFKKKGMSKEARKKFIKCLLTGKETGFVVIDKAIEDSVERNRRGDIRYQANDQLPKILRMQAEEGTGDPIHDKVTKDALSEIERRHDPLPVRSEQEDWAYLPNGKLDPSLCDLYPPSPKSAEEVLKWGKLADMISSAHVNSYELGLRSVPIRNPEDIESTLVSMQEWNNKCLGDLAIPNGHPLHLDELQNLHRKLKKEIRNDFYKTLKEFGELGSLEKPKFYKDLALFGTRLRILQRIYSKLCEEGGQVNYVNRTISMINGFSGYYPQSIERTKFIMNKLLEELEFLGHFTDELDRENLTKREHHNETESFYDNLMNLNKKIKELCKRWQNTEKLLMLSPESDHIKEKKLEGSQKIVDIAELYGKNTNLPEKWQQISELVRDINLVNICETTTGENIRPSEDSEAKSIPERDDLLHCRIT